jgi:hypothetical protein
MSKVYFAWVLVGARVNAQKWYGVPVTGTGSKKPEPLLLVELDPSEADWPFDALKHKYPYEGAK